MENNRYNDFSLERRLKETDPELHENMKACIVVMNQMLNSVMTRFTLFTDHTILHGMNVLNYCNKIIGPEDVKKLSPEECYILILACYMHDVGMGIREKDLEEMLPHLDVKEDDLMLARTDTKKLIRLYHQDLSGLAIQKYGDLFEFPSEDIRDAIILVCRGHRKTDLFDTELYKNYQLNGHPVRTPYLAAVLRLADEIDIGRDRNPEFMYDVPSISDPYEQSIFHTHEYTRFVELTDDAVIIHLRTELSEINSILRDWLMKIEKTLDYCREVCRVRSDLEIRQKKLIVKEASKK